MTKERAIEELTRAADLCPTTPLAEACRLAVKVMICDCVTCRHVDRMPNVYPCNECHVGYREPPSKWELEEVDNGQTD